MLINFRFGYSPLHIAALNEYSYCANMLLAYGADITARYALKMF
jgi:ankyrin repeat protein